MEPSSRYHMPKRHQDPDALRNRDKLYERWYCTYVYSDAMNVYDTVLIVCPIYSFRRTDPDVRKKPWNLKDRYRPASCRSSLSQHHDALLIWVVYCFGIFAPVRSKSRYLSRSFAISPSGAIGLRVCLRPRACWMQAAQQSDLKV